jgi:hypothetical protein
LKWLHHETDRFDCFPRLDEAHNRVIIQIVELNASPPPALKVVGNMIVVGEQTVAFDGTRIILARA